MREIIDLVAAMEVNAFCDATSLSGVLCVVSGPRFGYDTHPRHKVRRSVL
jgi:hypothetical protein